MLEAAGKWNCHQFHVGTEFFSDFGVYDVRMTVPRGWPLAATGRERERTDNADGTTTHRYYQEDVHDFAWTTSPDFVEARERFEHPGLPPVDMRLMLQPEHASQAARHFEGTRATLRHYGEWFGAYPYGHITIVDPAWQSESDGMEYPTLFTVGTWWLDAARRYRISKTRVVHETGPSVVVRHGRHQRVRGRLDGRRHQSVRERARHGRGVSGRPRGAAILRRVRAVGARGRAMGPGDGRRGDRSAYRSSPTVDVQSTPSFRYWPRTSTPMTYAKPALWLHTLERALGWTTMQQVLSTFFDRWKFKHPRPGDLFQVANEVSGRDLTPFFDQVYRGSAVFDYGVDSVTSTETDDETFVSEIVVRRHGDGIFPGDYSRRRSPTASSGASPGTAAAGGTVSRSSMRAARFRRRSIPIRFCSLDTNFTNNSFTTEPQAGRAATKWAATWMVWLQDQLLTWAFFV